MRRFSSPCCGEGIAYHKEKVPIWPAKCSWIGTSLLLASVRDESVSCDLKNSSPSCKLLKFEYTKNSQI